MPRFQPHVVTPYIGLAASVPLSLLGIQRRHLRQRGLALHNSEKGGRQSLLPLSYLFAQRRFPG